MNSKTIVRTLTKRLVVVGSIACIAGLALLLAVPTLLGSKWIYQPLVERIDSVRLRWFSPLRFEGIRLHQTDGTGLVSIAELKSDRGLFGYLLGGRQLGRIEIIKPSIDVRLLSDSTNLDRFVKAIEGKSPRGPKGSRSKLQVDLQVAIRGLSAKVVRQQDSEPLVIVPEFEVDVQYLGAQQETELRIAPTEVLKQVELTPELLELGLGHAIPLLAKSAWFDGRLSLSIGDLSIPLDRPTDSAGTAELTLHQVRSGPTQPAVVGALDLLAQWRGKEPHHELVFVDGSIIKIDVGQGRVNHEGLQVGLPKIDPRFQLSTSGSVGIVDKELDLVLGIPVPVEQLARREQVKQLGVPTIGLPIRGTLDEPRVEWQQLRGESAQLIALMRTRIADEAPGTAAALSALEGLASGEADQTIAAAVDLFKELRDRRLESRQPETDKDAASEAIDTSSAETSKRPIRDAIRDIFRKK
jgi:hypothetical protein